MAGGTESDTAGVCVRAISVGMGVKGGGVIGAMTGEGGMEGVRVGISVGVGAALKDAQAVNSMALPRFMITCRMCMGITITDARYARHTKTAGTIQRSPRLRT